MKFYNVMAAKDWEFCNNNSIRMLIEARDLLKRAPDTYNKFSFGYDWILDNSTALGEEVLLADYINLVKRYDPPVVIVPDVLNDTEKTLERTEAFLSRLELMHPKYVSNLMYVPQGKTAEDFTQCLESLILNFDPDLIGIPYRYDCAIHIQDRQVPIEWALDRALLIRNVIQKTVSPHVGIHLLGLWHPFELITGQLMGIRSADSSLLLRSVVDKVSPYCGKRGLNQDVFEQAVDYERFKDVYRDFNRFVQLIGGKDGPLPDRLNKSFRDKGAAAERDRVGATRREGSKDPGSAPVE